MDPTLSLVPHAVCWASAPRLIWTMVVTNLVTFLSYVIICGTLLFLVRRTRHSIARDWYLFVVGFALFIVACGSTHLLEVVTTWIPIFWVDAGANLVTAALSASVAVLLIRRASIIGFSINDYANRLAETQSEKLKMEDSLLAARKLEDWSRMSASVAHEINSPLDSIQNLLHLIRTSEGITPEIAMLTDAAAAEAANVATISRSTLTFFRSTGVPEKVDLCLAAESVGHLLERHLRHKSISYQTESSGDVHVEAFGGEPRQVLLNLVRNACEASPEGGAIKVALRGDSQGVEITVSDEGSGIHPAELPRLFRFGRSTKGTQGNGMGLWAVKHILAKHHGNIEVQSTLGKGTSFTLWWPRHFSGEDAPASLPLSLIGAEG